MLGVLGTQHPVPGFQSGQCKQGVVSHTQLQAVSAQPRGLSARCVQWALGTNFQSVSSDSRGCCRETSGTGTVPVSQSSTSRETLLPPPLTVSTLCGSMASCRPRHSRSLEASLIAKRAARCAESQAPQETGARLGSSLGISPAPVDTAGQSAARPSLCSSPQSCQEDQYHNIHIPHLSGQASTKMLWG